MGEAVGMYGECLLCVFWMMFVLARRGLRFEVFVLRLISESYKGTLVVVVCERTPRYWDGNVDERMCTA